MRSTDTGRTEVLLKDLLVTTKDGDWGKGEQAPGLAAYRVIRGTDFARVREGELSSVPLRYLPETTVWRRTLEPYDILIETAGGTSDRPTGRTLFVTPRILDGLGLPATCASFARFLRVDPAMADPAYIFWYLQDLYQRDQMRQHEVRHTGVGRFQYTRFAETEKISLPPLTEQRGIAATLGALDDKIDSNQRAIESSQQLSRLLYREWRERCDQQVKTTFGDFADVFGGATPKTSEPKYWNGGVVWATPTDITSLRAPYLFGTARTISQEGLDSTSAVLHPPGTIFMTSRATIGAFAVTHIPAATNQGFIAVRPREPEQRWFLFEEMRTRVQEFLDNANGSTFLEISRGRFKSLPLLVPVVSSLAELDRTLAPLHANAARLEQESMALASVRESLLPELLARRVRVPEAEEAVVEADA
jgi:type I restriction enzyme S subunit